MALACNALTKKKSNFFAHASQTIIFFEGTFIKKFKMPKHSKKDLSKKSIDELIAAPKKKKGSGPKKPKHSKKDLIKKSIDELIAALPKKKKRSGPKKKKSAGSKSPAKKKAKASGSKSHAKKKKKSSGSADLAGMDLDELLAKVSGTKKKKASARKPASKKK